MITTSPELKTVLQQSVAINPSVKVVAEWNYNRFAIIDKVANGTQTAEQEYDNNIFPLSSITDPERPTEGIVKSFTNEGVVPVSPYSETQAKYRPVTTSDEDVYKYWVSANVSGASTPYTISAATPSVVYKSSVNANKIRVAFERGHSTPTAFTVDITLDGATWTTIASNPTISSNGVVQLYRQPDNTWGSTINRGPSTPLKGVRVTISALNKGGARAAVIELGLRREDDISQYVKSYSVDMNMSEVSYIAPLGEVTSNESTVELDNTSFIFTNDNPASPYFDLLDSNVSVFIEMGINKGTMADPNYEWVRQFTGRSREWGGQTRSGTSLQLSDDAPYLQSINPPRMLLSSVTAAEAIWRVLDSVGFSYWKFDSSDVDNSPSAIPYFWTDDEKTVWEVISEIAEHFQCAVYFDEFGILQILTRTQAFSDTATPVWQLDAVVDSKLPDIKEATVVHDFETNIVNIEYSPTDQSEESPSGVRPMEVVWEPEDTLVLRSNQLKKTMTETDMVFSINAPDTKTWPYNGVVQVEGEFIRYDAKEYGYWNTLTTTKNVFITSEEERQKLDRISADLNRGASNAFTGRFRVAPKGRGIWATSPKIHDLDYSNWTSKRYRYGSGPIRTWEGGFVKNPNESILALKTNATWTPSHFYVCTQGYSADPGLPIYYGTRMKFDTSGYTYGAGGIVIGAGSNDSGYYVEIQRTSVTDTTYRAKYGGEVQVYYRSSSGSITRLNKGSALDISPGVWYDIDVKFSPGASTRQIDVMINGTHKLTAIHAATVPADNQGGRNGIWVRGFTYANFEYFYNSRSAPEAEVVDGATWWNRIKGGYQSNQYDYEYSYGQYVDAQATTLTGSVSIRRPVQGSKRFMDDFGPIVHEVREFDVKFENGPVAYSMAYFSNETQAACPEYNADAFGAKFLLANISRDNAVMNGEDTLTFGSENPVTQKLFIYGRTFIKKDSRTHTVSDERAVRRRGKVTTTISSQWIQSEGAAQALGDWIVSQWSGGNDQVEVESFGNPLLQIGDLVSINYPSKSMSPDTHRYFIVGIKHAYGHGLNTSYTLRRKK